MTKVTWLRGNDIQLPEIGMASEGDVIEMPDSAASAYVSQGQAEYFIEPKPEKLNDSLRTKK